MARFPQLSTRFLTALVILLGTLAIGWIWVSLGGAMPLLIGLLSGLVGIQCLREWLSMAHSFSLKFWGAMVIFSSLICFTYLGYCGGYHLVSYVILTACCSDSLAYFAGCTFKGPKLCPLISPQKTYSGFLFSLIATPLVMATFSTYFLPFPAGIIWHFPVWFMLTLSSQLGDLLESWAKRLCNVKDSGTFLPGHGGLLDRIDSWLAAAMTCTLLFLWGII